MRCASKSNLDHESRKKPEPKMPSRCRPRRWLSDGSTATRLAHNRALQNRTPRHRRSPPVLSRNSHNRQVTVLRRFNWPPDRDEWSFMPKPVSTLNASGFDLFTLVSRTNRQTQFDGKFDHRRSRGSIRPVRAQPGKDHPSKSQFRRRTSSFTKAASFRQQSKYFFLHPCSADREERRQGCPCSSG